MGRWLSHVLVAWMCLAASSASVSALTIVPESGDANWHAFNTEAFFQGSSWDGAGCNSGNWISGTGGCGGAGFYDYSPGLTPDYLGSGDTAFDFVTQGTVTLQFLERFTAWESVFGWIDASGNTHPLFTNKPNAVGSTFTFTPGGWFALYELTPDGLFSTHQAGRPSQFAAFKTSADCAVIGAEDIDRTHARNDHDFQDTIVRVCSSEPPPPPPTPVPEPATLTLLATGLFAAARYRRRA
jgi:hypothetical protein